MAGDGDGDGDGAERKKFLIENVLTFNSTFQTFVNVVNVGVHFDE